jgi:hypothetical protein
MPLERLAHEAVQLADGQDSRRRGDAGQLEHGAILERASAAPKRAAAPTKTANIQRVSSA